MQTHEEEMSEVRKEGILSFPIELSWKCRVDDCDGRVLLFRKAERSGRHFRYVWICSKHDKAPNFRMD